MTIVCAAALLAGCETNGNNNGPLAGLQVKLSGLFAIGDIRVDDTVIAVGTGENGGIEYLLPAQGTTTHNISFSESFITTGFAVANGWIACRNFDGDVFLHDTATDSTIEVDEADLALPSGNAATNEFWADEAFIVTYTDNSRVSDGHKIKFLDCSQDPPTITSFTMDIPDQPGPSGERVILAIDADRREVVALQLDVLYLYDMDAPDAAPETFDLAPAGGAGNLLQFQYDNGFVVYQARQLTGNGLRETRWADLDNRVTDDFPQNPTEPLDILLVNDVFGYYVHQVDEDVNTNTTTRSVWGTLDANGPVYTELHDVDDFIGPDREDGLIGYGLRLAATKDGVYRFIAGGGNPAIAEVLQVSKNGSAFEVMPTMAPFQNSSPHGLPATNVVTSNAICAFRAGGDDEVGYIELP